MRAATSGDDLLNQTVGAGVAKAARDDSYLRSIAKALSWRCLATATTVLIVWLLTGRPSAALMVGALEIVIKTLVYLLHERVWNRIDYGRGVMRACRGPAEVIDAHRAEPSRYSVMARPPVSQSE